MRTLMIDLTSFVPNKNHGAQTFIISLIESFKADKSHKKIIICSNSSKFFFGDAENIYFRTVLLPSNFLLRSLFSLIYLNYFNLILMPDKVFYPLNLSYTFGQNVFVYLHDLVCVHYMQNYYWKDSFKYHLLYLKYRIQFSKILNVAVPSVFVQKQFNQTFRHKNKPIVIREGRVSNSITTVPEIRDKNEKVFLVNSLTAKHKNIDDIIDAINILKNEKLDFKVVFKFTGNLNPKIKEFVKHFRSKKLELIKTGYLTNDQINSEISNCTAMIFCTSYEGFGIPVLEAMEASKPIICSDLHVLREFRYNGQFFYKNNSPESLKNQIIKVLHQPKNTVSISSQLKKYDWNNIVNWILK